MEYTELADYPIPPGVITEWIPSAAASAWRIDDRAISTNHIAHLATSRLSRSSTESTPKVHSETETCRGNWIGTAFKVDAPLDHADFAHALTLWIDRHEAYRTTTSSVSDPDTEPQRLLLDSGTVCFDIHQYGRVRGSSESYTHLENFFADSISADQWPHLAAVTIEPEVSEPDASAPSGFIVVIAADHSVMDAYTQLLLIPEIRALYLATRAGDEAPLPPCGSYVDYSSQERCAADAITATHPAVEAWKSFWQDEKAENSGFPLPISSRTQSGSAHQSSLSTWLLSEDETRALNAACKQLGGSLSGGALTALSIAMHRLSGQRKLRYVMPMHTRTRPEWQSAAGWFVGLAPVSTDLGDAEDFASAMNLVAGDARRHQELAQHSYPRIAELANVRQAPGFVVSFVDGRHVPGAAEWTAQDRALRSRTPDRDEVYLWINRTHAGINLSLRFPNNETASASVHALIAELSAVLREVAGTGTAAVSGGPLSSETALIADQLPEPADRG